jgi:hypothetical protein
LMVRSATPSRRATSLLGRPLAASDATSSSRWLNTLAQVAFLATSTDAVLMGVLRPPTTVFDTVYVCGGIEADGKSLLFVTLQLHLFPGRCSYIFSPAAHGRLYPQIYRGKMLLFAKLICA